MFITILRAANENIKDGYKTQEEAVQSMRDRLQAAKPENNGQKPGRD
jgi:hypothetical protein